MKTQLKIASMAVLTVFGMQAGVAVAEVNLVVDDNIKVTAINGNAVNTSIFQGAKKQFSLQAGTQVITAKYDRLYNFRNGDHDYLRSGNITVTANMLDNQTYQLTMPNQPEKYQDAKIYAQNPTLAIMQGGQVLASQNNQTSGGLLSSVGSTIGSVFTGNQSAINANSQVMASIPAAANASAQPSSVSTLDQFMSLWLKASEQERTKIRQWISTQ